MMIYTCTLNPSLDYKIEIDQIKLGELNRYNHYLLSVGGKGINVSIILNHLKIDHIAMGFLGGFIGDYISSFLDSKKYINHRFIKIKNDTRINIKIKEKEETELNAFGPIINDDEINHFLKQLNELEENDILILSGSIHPNHVDLYEKIASLCFKNHVKMIADIPGNAYHQVIRYKPWMIKPNLKELEEHLNQKLDTESLQIDAVRKLIQQGVSHVLLSLGKKGSIYGTKDSITLATPHLVSDHFTIGAGDAMIAGFIFADLNQMNHEEKHQISTHFAEKVTLNKDNFNDGFHHLIKVKKLGE